MVKLILDLCQYKIDCLNEYAKDFEISLNETIDFFTDVGIYKMETEIDEEIEKRYNK
jgi:hypothetical protein